jgi:hypothetical protein
MLQKKLLRQIRGILLFFMIMMVLSGVTAVPVESGIRWLLGYKDLYPPGIPEFLETVYQGAKDTNQRYPFLFYGFDWLAFAHIVIAIAFIGPWRDPVRNIWVVEWGMINCIAIVPLALIMGPIRGIPFYWQMIDCSFGVIGMVPLWICRAKIRRLGQLQAEGMSPSFN